MNTLDLIENEEWDDLVDMLFRKKGNREIPIRSEMIDILESRGNEIAEMYEVFDKNNTEDRQDTMKYHFPELSDYNEEPKSIESFEPKLTKCICVSFYMSENIDNYYNELEQKVEALRNYICDGEDT